MATRQLHVKPLYKADPADELNNTQIFSRSDRYTNYRRSRSASLGETSKSSAAPSGGHGGSNKTGLTSDTNSSITL